MFKVDYLFIKLRFFMFNDELEIQVFLKGSLMRVEKVKGVLNFWFGDIILEIN